jgi:hypothetical protein
METKKRLQSIKLQTASHRSANYTVHFFDSTKPNIVVE